ncbi:bacteriohemerythrin [Terasakiella sp. A23]|uniref:bacteriohemerythrin n=1 Tax=Terasakiella sp. FCG-A23 TaxID=3080561 RepID=UPI0029536257|nr:bacteriohemerythrin [Terasakiella sp. A23]MDV7340405.1 bacteriohemerythrin [Terasakiella sp. A23]
MGRLAWSEDYNVGDAEIDRQHQDLFALIDRLDDASLDTSSMGVIFEKLDIYVREHFHDEEELLKQVGYDDLDAHLRQHDEFREWLSTAKESFKSEHADNGAVGHNLQVFLRDWLLNHIIKTDQAYKSWVEGR